MNKAFEICKRMLVEVRKDFPTAILAGGALRDAIILEDVPKDYDFFILWEPSVEVLRHNQMTFEQGASDDPGARVDFVVKKTYLGHDVDLIIVPPGRDALAIIQEFDIDLCRVAWDGTSLIEDDRFRQDWYNKTVTNRRDLEQSRERMRKIAQKFEFTPVDLSPPPAELPNDIEPDFGL